MDSVSTGIWSTFMAGTLAVLGIATSAIALPAGRFEGRPAFEPGASDGVFIWYDSGGHHVRFTTKGETRRFKGRVCAAGAITKWDAVRRDYGDKVRLAPDRQCIFFSFKTRGGLDGFTFRAPKGSIELDLRRGDGKSVSAKDVYIGARHQHPDDVPFVLRAR